MQMLQDLIVCQAPAFQVAMPCLGNACGKQRKQCSQEGRDDVQRYIQRVQQINHAGKQPRDCHLEQAGPFQTVPGWILADSGKCVYAMYGVHILADCAWLASSPATGRVSRCYLGMIDLSRALVGMTGLMTLLLSCQLPVVALPVLR